MSRSLPSPSARGNQGRTQAMVLIAVLAVGLIALGLREQRLHQRGEVLFNGLAPMQAGSLVIPPQAGGPERCASCHLAAGGAGPLLTAASLTRPQARRGGAPSVYDRSAFCRALREGVDPSGMKLAATMPHVAVSDEECSALWAFLKTR